MTDTFENPYAPPKEIMAASDRHLSGPYMAWHDKRTLIVRRGAELPDRCVKCNAPAEGYRYSKSVSWIRPVWLILLISPLLFVLAYFFVRWKATISVGVCPRHRRLRRRAIVLGWLGVLAGYGVFFLEPVVPTDVHSYGIVGGLTLMIGGMIGGMLGSRILMPTKIDENLIWLANVSPAYLAEFRDWNA